MKPSIQAPKAPKATEAPKAATHFFSGTPFGKFFQIQKFPNGYEASIVHHEHSIGASSGLFEIAVIESATGKIFKSWPGAPSDVEGDLTFREVADMLDAIAEL